MVDRKSSQTKTFSQNMIYMFCLYHFSLKCIIKNLYLFSDNPLNVINEGVQSASHDPTSYPSPICLPFVLGGAGEEELGHDASLIQISAPLECYQLCSNQ